MSHTPTEVTIKARFAIKESPSIMQSNSGPTRWTVSINGVAMFTLYKTREDALGCIQANFGVSPEHIAQYPL